MQNQSEQQSGAIDGTASPQTTTSADSVQSASNPAVAAMPATVDAEPVPATTRPQGRLRGRRRAEAEGPLSPSTTSATSTAAPTPSTRPHRVVRVAQQIPPSLLEDPELAKAVSVLPANYNFEIYKTIWRIQKAKATCVALQFPEGLIMYSCIISDILQRFAGVETVIMGDVTYGACCVDDYTARALGCDFMVHYGHSCLVPIDVSSINMLYVFVEIGIDVAHLLRSLKSNFPKETRMALAGTIQFAAAIAAVAGEVQKEFEHVLIPQARPLSKGEVLGCTSPRFEGCDIVVFVSDGRFHLESMMIANPHIRAFYKYDPYSKRLTREEYDHSTMHELRHDAIERATHAKKWGLILGTLGRQGNMKILQRLEREIRESGREVTMVLLSEIFPDKLAKMSDVEAWVQVACPRLSIDWGYAFPTPLLSSYEAEVALSRAQWLPNGVYPMDYYADNGGTWSNYHPENKQSNTSGNKKINPIRAKKEARAAAAAMAAAAAKVAESGKADEAPTSATAAAPKLQIAYATE